MPPDCAKMEQVLGRNSFCASHHASKIQNATKHVFYGIVRFSFMFFLVAILFDYEIFVFFFGRYELID